MDKAPQTKALMPLDQLCPCTAIPIKPKKKQEEDGRAYQQFLSLNKVDLKEV